MRHSRLTILIALSFLLPSVVQAACPPIIATNIVPGCKGNAPIVTLTLTNFGACGWTMYYHFNPPSPGILASNVTNPAEVPIPANYAPGTPIVLKITNSIAATGGIPSDDYPLVVPSCGKGLTWRLISTNAPTGTIRVGCGTSSSQNECNPTQGDTPWTTALPILCIRKTGTGFPLPTPVSVDNSNKYNKWAGGIVGTTSATVPPATLSGANALCANEFGADWRVAEFHDGWGWYFQAYGGVSPPTKRFWVHINDQPGATCWH
jgi:hypothetical protein